MKKTKVIVLMLIALALSGCNGFLNQKPQSFISSDTFYQTPSQINEALNGVYNGLAQLYDAGGPGGSSFWAMTEMRSDNTTFTYNAADRGQLMREQMDYFLVTPDNTYSLTVWRIMYHTIEQANTLLGKIGNVTYPSAQASEKNQVIGQAEFIRALVYFNLVRLYGGNIPLLTKAISSPAQTKTIKQSTLNAVYAQISKDATDAASKLPATWTGNNLGRATKGAANTLLGDIYMTMGQPGNKANYQKADTYFQKVISSGDYSLLANYADLWDTKHKNSSESVFEIQYSGATTNEYSSFFYIFAPRNSSAVTTGFPLPPQTGDNIPTRNIEKAYAPGDLRYPASIAWFVDPSNTQWALAQHDSVPYINKYATPYPVPNKTDNDFYVYRYAQVLLWDAEAKNEVNGPTAQAYNYVNMVRNRAGLSNLATGMTKAQFETAVWHEERVEGAFEDHRWFQLLRTGQAIKVMKANGAEQKAYQGSWLPAGSYNIASYKLLFPIPQRDITLQGYTQNPGWPK